MVLRLRVPAPGGWEQAKCRGQVQRLPGDTEVYDPFFLEDDADQQDALDFCNGTIDDVRCPIRDECLIFAATNNERYGVYGGMSEGDRKIMRKIWPWQGGKLPRPEWRWFTHDELQELLDAKIASGEISIKQLEEDDEDEPD